MLSGRTRSPAYIHLALSYIEFARNEKNLFELIASVDDFGTRTIGQFLAGDEGSQLLGRIAPHQGESEEQKRELFTMFWMFVHGMAALIAGNRVQFSEREIKIYIKKAYEGFVSSV